MMNSINLMGRLVRDPECTNTQSGTLKAVFTIAVDRDFKSKGEERKTDFIPCIAWSKTAEIIRDYFVKGSLCGVNGRLEINSYTDHDGNRKNYTQVQVAQIYFGQAKGTAPASAPPVNQPEPAYAQEFAALEEDDSDLPF